MANKKTGIYSSIIISLLLIAFAYIFILYRQNIIDQIIVWQYHPSTEISGLIERAGMNDQGKFLFFASQPALYPAKDASIFNKDCDRVESTTAILGCYSNFRIYIYDVTDKQLDGVREVTAAHETLHAVYARMNSDEKTKVDNLIESEYKQLKNNKELADLVAFYNRTEPGQRDNELHSIIGTEIASINPELETHYSKYFSNRQKVVSLNAKYIGVFNQLKIRADALLAQYNALSSNISTRLSQYNSDVEVFNNDVAAFNQRANNQGFSSQDQFTSERNALVARSAELATVRNVIIQDTNKLEAILKAYNSIASESKKLYNVIDSSPAPASSI